MRKRKKYQEYLPEENVEYVFRFYNVRKRKASLWRFIYDGTMPNGKYAFFTFPGGGIDLLDPRRFNFIMENNLIEQRAIKRPERVDIKEKLLQQERKRKEEEDRKSKKKSDAWMENVLTQFSAINTYQKAEIEQRLSMPFETFMRDVRRFASEEALSFAFVSTVSKNIYTVAEMLKIKLKAL